MSSYINCMIIRINWGEVGENHSNDPACCLAKDSRIVLRAKAGLPRKCPRGSRAFFILYRGACAPARGALGYKFLRGGALFVDGGASEGGQDEFDETHDRGDPQKPVREDGQRPVHQIWKKVADHPISEPRQHGGSRTRTEASARSRIEPNCADAYEEAPDDEDGNCTRRHLAPKVLHGCGPIRSQDSAVGDIFENVNDDPRHDPTCNDAAPIDFSHGCLQLTQNRMVGPG